MIRQTAMLALAALGLSSCETTEQATANRGAQLQSTYVNRPLSDFMLNNGVTPRDAFDLPGRRVFIFGMPCVSWWHTKPVGNAKSPADYVVEKVEIRGYCL